MQGTDCTYVSNSYLCEYFFSDSHAKKEMVTTSVPTVNEYKL